MMAPPIIHKKLPQNLRKKIPGSNTLIRKTWDCLHLETAPPGVLLYYRNPEDNEDEVWKYWGETPDLYPPPGLETGLYIFEFRARLGAEESAVETFEIFVEGL
jgi:hypothetical protein